MVLEGLLEFVGIVLLEIEIVLGGPILNRLGRVRVKSCVIITLGLLEELALLPILLLIKREQSYFIRYKFLLKLADEGKVNGDATVGRLVEAVLQAD